MQNFWHFVPNFGIMFIGHNDNNFADALQLGSMWGTEKGMMLLREAGFENVSVEPIPFFGFNVLYKATKKE